MSRQSEKLRSRTLFERELLDAQAPSLFSFLASILVGLALLGTVVAGFGPAVSGATYSQFNAKQLQTGRFQYRTFLDGKDAGTSDMSIHEGSFPGTFIYTNRVTGQFGQQWEAIASTNFTPISAKLSFGNEATLRLAFELKYQSGRVTGFVIPRHSDMDSKLKVDLKVMADTVDQRIDWAAVMSHKDLIPGREFLFYVFDPGSGNSRVTARVVGPEKVRVPAGTFDALRIIYQIEKSAGTETYQVLTNKNGPRMLLREEFPNTAVTELVKVQAG